MYKSFFSSLIFISTILTEIISAQETISIQINGGFIYPENSTNGLTALVQFNYPLNEQFHLYVYSGYSSWDKNKVIFKEGPPIYDAQENFFTYSADDHTMIPVYFGSFINLHTNKIFTAYINLEAGYSYLSYNSYENWKSVNPYTGRVIGYYVDRGTKEEITENLYGVGIGAGISHPMRENLNLEFSLLNVSS